MMPTAIMRIGDVCKVIAGQSPDGKHYNESGNGLPFYQGKRDFGDKFILQPRVWTSETTKIAEANDVLMSVRAPVGPINFSTERVCIGRGLAAIRAGRGIDNQFLFYALLSKQAEISGTEGAVFASISKSQIEAIKIWVPDPATQRRIVGILDEAFAGLETLRINAEKNLYHAQDLFDRYLNAIFTQKGDEWVERSLGQLAVFKNGLNFTKSSKGETIKIVGVKDFQDHLWIPRGGLDNVQIEGVLSREYELRKHDILTVRSNGNKQLIGRCILADHVDGKTSHSGFTIRIRITAPGINPIFLLRFLKSEKIRRMLIESGDGANISSLNQKALTGLPIAYPSEIRQLEIVVRLQEIEEETSRLASLYTRKLAAIAELKQSLLQKAFSGQLTSSEALAA